MSGGNGTPPKRAFTGMYTHSPGVLKKRANRVRRIVQRMRAVMKWLEPSDYPACRAWAELEVLGSHAFMELDTNGLLNAQGDARRLLGDLLKLRSVQATYTRELGMTPLARMAIRVSSANAALDLVASMAAGEATAEPAETVEPEKEHGAPSDGGHDSTEG